jgi:hypothetical protein
MAGGAHGAVIVASQPDESRLYRMASHNIKPFMPPGGKLSESDLETLRDWIAAGASFEGFEEPAPARDSLSQVPDHPITPEERSYWAFQPPKRVGPFEHRRIPTNFHARQGTEALTPSDRRTLSVARIWTTGLPPAPDEVDAFGHQTARPTRAPAGGTACSLRRITASVGRIG